MQFDIHTWRSLSALLDQALDLPPHEHPAWLRSLPADQAPLESVLRDLLTRRSTLETLDFLERLPPFTLADSDRDHAALRAGSTVGPYRLIRVLGHGGMGAVWLAERADGLMKRAVALKLPHVIGSRAALAERFARERDILAALEHPNIARLYDAGFSADGQPYLALEYVEGKPITATCDEQKLDVRARIALFKEAILAVQHAHARLVLHRDLKPSNILVTRDGAVKLLDFGIAKLLADGQAHETELTQFSGRALTPDYASPEQILGQSLTTASDVYSLGVLLYELLAGVRPYRLKRGSRAELEEAILEQDIERPSAAAARAGHNGRQISDDLDTILSTALCKDSQQRYVTASSLGEELDRYLDGRAIQARPASSWYRLQKFVTRNRWAVSGVSAALIVLTGFGLFAAIQARDARVEAAKAESVKNFLTSLFSANSIDQGNSAARRQLSAQQLLEEGARRIDSQFLDQPVLRADLQGVIGQLLHDLGQGKQSLAIREQRLAALEQAGAHSRDKALALKDVADTLLQVGEEAEARARLASAIHLLTDSPGVQDQVEYWALRSQLGLLEMTTAEQNEAKQSIELAADRLSALAPESVQHASALYRLSQLRAFENRLNEGVALLEASLAMHERLLGANSFRLAQLRFSAANDLLHHRRYGEATLHLDRALKILEDTAGPDHPSTGLVLMTLGRSQSIRGDVGGRAQLQRALAIFQRRVDDVDPLHVARAHLYVGESLLDEGRITASSEPLTTAMAGFAALPAAAEKTVAAGVFARFLLDTGRYAEAIAVLSEARQQRAAIFGAAHPAVASLTNRIGIVQMAAGNLNEAEATFRSVERMQTEREDAFGSPRHLARANLTAIEMDRGNYSSVVSAMRDIFEAFYRLAEPERGRLAEAQINLRMARALVGAGQADQAESMLTRATHLTEDLYEHAPVRITLNCQWARYLAAMGNKPAALKRIELAKVSLVQEPALGPQFRRAVLSAEADVRKAP